MKVIVIRQPWAWLIVHGFKDIENRSWRMRYRGTLPIQASAGLPTKSALDEIRQFVRADIVMRLPMATLPLLLLLTHLVYGADGRMTLILPHTLRSGETPWLEVKVGAISRGQEIEISTAEGRFLGVISPFGIRSGHDAGTYTVPLPFDAILDNRVSPEIINHFVRSSATGSHKRGTQSD